LHLIGRGLQCESSLDSGKETTGSSADATKEIKELIESTLTKVKSGEKLVEQGDSDFRIIFENMQQVSNILNSISQATQDQSSSINQINVAIGQLDNVTQQNSSLVEEISGASEHMAFKASEMEKLITKSFGNKIEIFNPFLQKKES